MNKRQMLASVKVDTSRVAEKIQSLLEMLPEHIPDVILGKINSLIGEVILVNCQPAVITSGTINIIYVFDFSPAAYNEVMAAARACKTNFTHE